jgi:capsular polysaccharide transport system permease protein
MRPFSPALPPDRGVRRVPLQRLRVLFALMVREMGAKFGRSVGGYIWAVAEPLGGIILLAVVFSLALRSPPIGTSFMIFYATGVIPFFLYNTIQSGAAKALRANRGLLNYPGVTPLDAIFATFVLDVLTMGIVALLLFGGIVLIYDVHINFEPGRVLTAFAMASVLGLGIGTLNSVLFGFFPTWKNLWKVMTRPLYLVSGVFFTYDSAPPGLKTILWYNPLAHIIGEMRSGFYGGYPAYYVSYTYVLGIALALFVIGAYLLRRHASLLIEQ